MFCTTSLRPGHSPPQVTTAARTCGQGRGGLGGESRLGRRYLDAARVAGTSVWGHSTDQGGARCRVTCLSLLPSLLHLPRLHLQHHLPSCLSPPSGCGMWCGGARCGWPTRAAGGKSPRRRWRPFRPRRRRLGGGGGAEVGVEGRLQGSEGGGGGIEAGAMRCHKDVSTRRASPPAMHVRWPCPNAIRTSRREAKALPLCLLSGTDTHSPPSSLRILLSHPSRQYGSTVPADPAVSYSTVCKRTLSRSPTAHMGRK